MSPQSSALALLALFFAPLFLLHGADPKQIDAAARRAAFLKILERPQVPLAAEEKLVSETNGVAKFHFSFTSETEQRVPGILLKKLNTHGHLPAVIVLHGTGGTKDSDSLSPYLDAFVQAGFISIAIDGRYHGERSKTGTGTGDYFEAIVRAYRSGQEHPFYYDTVWDVMRLVDYLQARTDINPKRIGLIGFSKGGIETYLAAAADPRLAVAVPCIGVQSFRWGLDNGQWKARIATIQDAFDTIMAEVGIKKPGSDWVRKFYDRLVPGIYEQFDGPAMLPLIAPRPLLVINGDSDANTPLAGVRKSWEEARLAYQEAQAGERLVLRVQENTGHTINPDSRQAAIDWLVKWLSP